MEQAVAFVFCQGADPSLVPSLRSFRNGSIVTSFQKLSEPAWQALAEALRTFYWFKSDFQTLVRAHFAAAPSALASVNFVETKRVATGQLVRALRLNERKYQQAAIDALVALSEFDPEFAHLTRLEEGHVRAAEARDAHKAVRLVIANSELVASRQAVRREVEESAARESSRRLHEIRLSELRDQFLSLEQSPDNPQRRGYEFQDFLNALFELWDLYPRAAYSLTYEQIDGAFTFRTDDYILEARWWAEPLGPKELNDFKVKVDGKARNTLGLCVSVRGFTEGAIERHSGGQTPLILMDGTDLMPILEGRIELTEVLARKTATRSRNR